MVRRFQRWIGKEVTFRNSNIITYGRDVLGWKQMNKEEIYEERDALMRSEYSHSIESFPDRMDRFLAAMNRVSSLL
jgi:hypothetical protein